MTRRKTYRWGAAIAAIAAILLILIGVLTTTRGARAVGRALGFTVSTLGLGELELRLNAPLIQGLHASKGAFSTSERPHFLAWKALHISRPRLSGTTIQLPIIDVEGLHVNLPPTPPGPPDPRDWLEQLHSRLNKRWLDGVPTLRINQLRLTGTTLAFHQAQGPAQMMTLDEANLSARVDDNRSQLELFAQNFAFQDLKITKLQTQLHRRPQQLRVSSLALESPQGELRVTDLRLNGKTQRWETQTFLAKFHGDKRQGNGSFEGTALLGQLQATLRYKGSTDLEAESEFSGNVSDLRKLSLTIQSHCNPCGPLTGPWDGRINLKGDAAKLDLHATLDLTAPEQSLQATLHHQPNKALDAKLSWDSHNLAHLATGLTGQTSGTANCRVRAQYQKLDCQVDAFATDLYPKTRAKAQLDVELSQKEGLRATINHIELEAFKQKVHSVGTPARLHVGPNASLSLQDLALKASDGRASLRAWAKQGDDGNLEAKIQATRWELGLLSAFVPKLALRGQLDLDLDLTKAGPNIAATAHANIKRLRWRGLSWGSLKLDLNQETSRLLTRVALNGPWAKATLKATVPTRNSGQSSFVQLQRQGFNASLILTKLKQKALQTLSGISDLNGELKGSLSVSGSLGHPVGTLQAQWIKPRWKAMKQSKVTLDATLRREALHAQLRAYHRTQEQLAFIADLPLLRGTNLEEIRWNKGVPAHLGLRLHALDVRPIAASFSDLNVKGRLDADIEIDGSSQNPRVRAWLSAWRPSVGSIRARDITLSLDHRDQHTTLHLLAFRGKGSLRAQARLPLTLNLGAPAFAWRPHDAHRLDLTLLELDASALEGLLHLPPTIHAQGEVHAFGNRKKHRIRGFLSLEDTRPEFRDLRVRSKFNLSQSNQHLQAWVEHRGKPVLSTNAELQTGLLSLIERPSSWPRSKAKIELNALPFDLRYLEPWLPEALHAPRGRFSAKLHAHGTLGHLQYRGNARIKDAKIAVVPLQQRITDLNARVQLRGQTLDIEHVSARAGRGSLSLAGSVGLDEDAKGSVRLALRRIPLRLPGTPSLEITGDLRSRVRLSPKEIRVDSKLQNAKIQVLELLTADVKSIPTNANVHFSDEIKVETHRHTSKLPVPPLKLYTRIDKSIAVQGPMIATNWSGELNLTRKAGHMTAQGKLQAAPNGSFELLNNRFVLRRGVLQFDKTQRLIPYIDLRVTTQIDGDDIVITGQGPASDPHLNFESSSNATREQIISSIITGSGQHDQNEGNKLIAQAVSALLMENGTGVNQIAQRIGVDNVRFSFGDSLSDTIVSAGSWVTPKVYLESKIRAQAPEGKSRVEGHVRYNFQKNWVLEGYVGDRNAGGGGLWWHRPPRTFKKAKPQPSD